MKILYITTGCFDKGGISRYSRYQITALREIYGDNSIRILSFLGPDKNSFETPFDVNWSGSGNGLLDRVLLVVVSFFYSIFWRPDVIHTAHVNYSGMAVLLSKLSGSTTVLNVYGFEIWTNLKRHALFGLKNSNFIISDCHATADYILTEGMRKDKSDISIIWDCVDTNTFKVTTNGFEKIISKYRLPDRNSNFIITTLGRMSKDAAYKGYDRLIKVFAKINQNHKDSYLLMIGRGDLIDSLKELAASLGITENIIFTGSVPDDELPLLLSYGKLFSLVTNSGDGMGEGLPLTPLEAMACGLPIIVGNQDGSREAIVDNLNGYCIDPYDLSQQVKIIEDLIINDTLLAEKSYFAQAIVKQHFSYVVFKSKTKELYQKKVKDNV